VEFGTPSTYYFLYIGLIGNPSAWTTVMRSNNVSNNVNAFSVSFEMSLPSILVSHNDLEEVKDFISSLGSSCSISDFIIDCSCDTAGDLDAQFPEIAMTIGTFEMRVSLFLGGSVYMYVDGSSCKSYFRSGSDFKNLYTWKFGLPIYRAFEINHDLRDYGRLGFVPQSASAKVEDSSNTLSVSWALLTLGSLALTSSNLGLF